MLSTKDFLVVLKRINVPSLLAVDSGLIIFKLSFIHGTQPTTNTKNVDPRQAMSTKFPSSTFTGIEDSFLFLIFQTCFLCSTCLMMSVVGLQLHCSLLFVILNTIIQPSPAFVSGMRSCLIQPSLLYIYLLMAAYVSGIKSRSIVVFAS